MTPVLLPRELAATYAGLSVSTLEKLVRKGQFPPPRKLSEGRVGWLRPEIDTWAEALPVSDILPGPGRSTHRPESLAESAAAFQRMGQDFARMRVGGMGVVP